MHIYRYNVVRIGWHNLAIRVIPSPFQIGPFVRSYTFSIQSLCYGYIRKWYKKTRGIFLGAIDQFIVQGVCLRLFAHDSLYFSFCLFFSTHFSFALHSFSPFLPLFALQCAYWKYFFCIKCSFICLFPLSLSLLAHFTPLAFSLFLAPPRHTVSNIRSYLIILIIFVCVK